MPDRKLDLLTGSLSMLLLFVAVIAAAVAAAAGAI
jgi:hypothetical protein